MNNDHDYSSSGFDSFLSRSIDDISQTNLDSAGPLSNSFRFDDMQTTGSQGDTWRIGDIHLDGRNESIGFVDGKVKPLFLGTDSQGNRVLKIAPNGVDAATASDDELLFNSLQKTLKIVTTIKGSYMITAGDISNSYAVIPILHGLKFRPTVIGSVKSSFDGRSRPLPFLFFGEANYFGSPPGAIVAVDSIDDNFIYLRLTIHDIFGLSLFASDSNLSYKLYCLQESFI